MREVHDLKTWPTFYKDIETGIKRFEIRNDDRDFEVGDYLLLREYDQHIGQYTGKSMFARVDYLMRRWPEMGLKDGYCIMSITKCDNLLYTFKQEEKHG